MSNDDAYKIRPAGRHILTIGRELIQDRYAAIVELVKNAYDADSPDVDIQFKASGDRSSYSITIQDHGHGMSRDTVINKWMVPSTDDKLRRRTSPGGRTMQGNKGVGRYAASILGDDLLLETVTPEGEKTTAVIEWKHFETAQYLDDVEILVETSTATEPSGTRLIITGGPEELAQWNKRDSRDRTQIDWLKDEIKKLISPVDRELNQSDVTATFRIVLSIVGFIEGQEDSVEEIKPFPIFDLFDYRISGTVSSDGKGLLKYSLQKARNASEEDIEFEVGSPTQCGELVFDIRVYDRDKDSIESLIGRGLKDEAGNYVGKLQARRILDEYNGIGVYRNAFRIRPLGDADFDWLKLNQQRVQNPSLRIGSNQVIGYVQIQSQEQSGLIEKSARDGLRENPAFEKLKQITNSVISILETRRFDYRRRAGLSKPTLKLERELERLFAFDELRRGVEKRLSKGGIDKQTTDEILGIITREEEQKNKLAEDIRQAVAIYQGQATLGKIINVVLHEGRRPLNYFKNEIPNMAYWYGLYKESGQLDNLDRFLQIAERIGENAEIFVKLFGRLDPLAAGKRSAKKPLQLKKTIESALAVFDGVMKKERIRLQVTGPDDFKLLFWLQDMYAIFTNLADNTIYWMIEKESKAREISVSIVTEGDSLEYIDYRDSGPGIESGLIESEVIFDPEFTTKKGGGTGLGLAIAGEAASRNGLELRALESDCGAYFRLQPKPEEIS